MADTTSAIKQNFPESKDYYVYNRYGHNIMQPVAPIALLGLPSSEDFVSLVDNHLKERRMEYLTEGEPKNFPPGFLRDSYIKRSQSVRFSSGEGKASINDSVRGHDCFIFCDVLNYSVYFEFFGKKVPMSPDEHFQDLVRMILACNDKAERVSVVMPFMYEGRQDNRNSRESLDCAYMLKELKALNVKNIVSFDPHDPRVENALPIKSIDNIPVTYQMIKALCREYSDLDFFSDKSTMVVSPDEKGIKRAMYYATVLGIPLGIFYREHDYSGMSKVTKDYVYLGDSPEGRDVLIVDDMIVTGNAIIEAAKHLKEHKAGRVFCIASYMVNVEGPGRFQKAIDDGYIDRVFATNLNYNSDELLMKDWFVSVDLSEFAALLIDALNHNTSISSLIDQTGKIRSLLERYQLSRRFNKLGE